MAEVKTKINRSKKVIKEFTLHGVTYRVGDTVKLSDSLLVKFKDCLEDAKPVKKNS